MRLAGLGALSFLLLLGACDGDGALDGGLPPADDGTPAGPAMVRVDYADRADLYAAPWPDERLRTGGRIDLAAFPNPQEVAITEQLRGILTGDARGFGRTSAVYFALTGPLREASLPSLSESVTDAASVALIDVDPDSGDRGRRHPVEVAFVADPGPFGAPNLLAVLPLQGLPLRAGTLYAAVVTTAVEGEDGEPLAPSPATQAILNGVQPAGLADTAFAAHRSAIGGLESAGLATADIAALAVFRTDDPVAGLRAAREQVLAGDLPEVEATFTAREVFDDFCVFESAVDMPVFQAGEAPYATEGGGWAIDDDGLLLEQRTARSRVVVTVPRSAMPDGGYPTVLFVRTGGGGDRPLVDRGPRDSGSAESVPGSGPAGELARRGFAGVSIDGPLGGLRNLDGWDEQFAIFNINNPTALRDSIRQSALELILGAHLVETLAVDAASCPGASAAARFDDADLTLMGHSMGATIGPLAVALEPKFRAMVLSGAGGSWIANVIYKLRPVPTRPTAEVVLGYTARGRRLEPWDPVLNLLQWAGEPADPPAYAHLLLDEPPAGEPRHVLMFQGILDRFIPPPIANAMSLSARLDLAGDARDEALDDDAYVPFMTLSPFADAGAVALPAAGNRGGTTAVLVQHDEDGILDGHEVVFQRDEPRRQYGCFLESLLDGTPSVPTGDGCE